MILSKDLFADFEMRNVQSEIRNPKSEREEMQVNSTEFEKGCQEK